jgi:hypothetical protein
LAKTYKQESPTRLTRRALLLISCTRRVDFEAELPNGIRLKTADFGGLFSESRVKPCCKDSDDYHVKHSDCRVSPLPIAENCLLKMPKLNSRKALNRKSRTLVLQTLDRRELFAADVVIDWNNLALDAIRASSTAPPVASRALAITQTAVYD